MPNKSSMMNLFWNPETALSLPGFLVNLALAAVLGFLLGVAYVYFGRSLSNRRLFARNFVVLAVTTTLVISIVKSSLALSLGLVGALSIVRFRAAIKEPEELAYLFLAISIGLGLGAGQTTITGVAFLAILAIVALQYCLRPGVTAPSLYLTVSGPRTAQLTASRILEVLSQGGLTAGLHRLDEGPATLEASYQLAPAAAEQLEEASRRLRDLNPDVQVSYVAGRGLSE